MKSVEREQLKRVARLYKRNDEAARALGIASATFSRKCREEGIETPAERKRWMKRQGS